MLKLKEKLNTSTENHHPPKRILILMSDTGGGHRAAAKAIAEGLDHRYGAEISVFVVDAWQDHVAWPVNKIGKSYGWIVNEAVWLWKALWLLERQPRFIDTLISWFYPLVAPGLLKLFHTYRPDVIVSVHPLITQLPLAVLKRNKLNIPFITVVTDMVKGYHTWYSPHTKLCLVSTPPARQQALNYGLTSQQVEVTGQPISLKLGSCHEEVKPDLRRRLGLRADRPTVLIVGGGEGFGPIAEIAHNIARQVPQAQLAVVAGRNQSLKRRLEVADWEIPIQIFGFVDNMPELMSAADVLVSKAGPGCIAEAFAANLPLILFDYIPGQEAKNVEYVINHNAGVYVPDPQKIAALLSEWLNPNYPKLAEMAQNAARLAHPQAALTIADHIYRQASIRQKTSTGKPLPQPATALPRSYATTSPEPTLPTAPAASTNA